MGGLRLGAHRDSVYLLVSRSGPGVGGWQGDAHMRVTPIQHGHRLGQGEEGRTWGDVLGKGLCVGCFLDFFQFLGHSWRYTGVPPGSVLQDHAWQARGTLWDARNRTRVCLFKANILPAVLSLWPQTEILFFNYCDFFGSRWMGIWGAEDCWILEEFRLEPCSISMLEVCTDRQGRGGN